jgi:hypothetical protein
MRRFLSVSTIQSKSITPAARSDMTVGVTAE